jgi:hypothetical protein
MADRFCFPLYVFRAMIAPGVVFRERSGEKHLPLFTSVQRANQYRNAYVPDAQIVRLKEPDDLRDVLLAHRKEAADFKIIVNPKT